MNRGRHNIPADWIVPEREHHTRHVRGIALADLQLVCGAGPYELDILVREQFSAPNLQLVGQVTLANRIFEPVPDLPLALIRGDAPDDDATDARETRPVTVVDARTDDFGEFDMVSDRDAAYGLRIGEGEDAPCVLVWEGSE